MGFIKTAVLIMSPVSVATIAAFSLGKQLPKACRWMGNNIGLGYLYFKCIVKVLKPSDEAAYEFIKVARQTSQQSQALRRQLRNTFKQVKDDMAAKKDELFNAVPQDLKDELASSMQNPLTDSTCPTDNTMTGDRPTGSSLMADTLHQRQRLSFRKIAKQQSQQFYTKI